MSSRSGWFVGSADCTVDLRSAMLRSTTDPGAIHLSCYSHET